MNTEQIAPDDSEERIDPGGSSGTPGASLGAPADAPGYEDETPLQNQDAAPLLPAEEEESDDPTASPADGAD